MEHLEWHNHAFIDENNIVIDVAVFDEWAHDHQLLEDAKILLGAAEVICCCTFGIASIGDEWTGSEFRPQNPFASWTWDSSNKQWQAPTPMPTEDKLYYWSENDLEWQEVEEPTE
jgi:hypothetical protein